MSIFPYIKNLSHLDYYAKNLAANHSSCVYNLRRIISLIQTIPNAVIYTDKIYAQVVTHCFLVDGIHIKLLLHKFIYITCKNIEQALMVYNSLLLDSKNKNPLVRKSSLKTLVKISECADEDIKVQCRNMVIESLNDPDILVISSVILLIANIFTKHIDESKELFAIVVNKLYSLIKHDDSLVVLNSLYALDKILENENGVVINKKIAQHLTNRLKNFENLHKTIILKYIDKYESKNSDLPTYEYYNNLNFSSLIRCIDKPLNCNDRNKYVTNIDDLLLKCSNQKNAELTFLIFDWSMKNNYAIDDSFLCYEANDPSFLKIRKLICSVVNSCLNKQKFSSRSDQSVQNNEDIILQLFKDTNIASGDRKFFAQLPSLILNTDTVRNNDISNSTDRLTTRGLDNLSSNNEFNAAGEDGKGELYAGGCYKLRSKNMEINTRDNVLNSREYFTIPNKLENTLNKRSSNTRTSNLDDDFQNNVVEGNVESLSPSFNDYNLTDANNTSFILNSESRVYSRGNVENVMKPGDEIKTTGDDWLPSDEERWRIHDTDDGDSHFVSIVTRLSILLKVEKEPVILRSIMLVVIFYFYLRRPNDLSFNSKPFFNTILPILNKLSNSAPYLVTMATEYLPLQCLTDAEKNELINLVEYAIFESATFFIDTNEKEQLLDPTINSKFIGSDGSNSIDETVRSNTEDFSKLIESNRGFNLYFLFYKLLQKKSHQFRTIMKFLTHKNIYCKRSLDIVKRFVNILSSTNHIRPSILIDQLEASMTIFKRSPSDGQMLLGRTLELCAQECGYFDERCFSGSSLHDSYNIASPQPIKTCHLDSRFKYLRYNDDDVDECKSMVLDFKDLKNYLTICYKRLMDLSGVQ